MEVACVVVFVIVELAEKDDFAGGIGGVWGRVGNFEARQAVVARAGRDVEDEEITIFGVVGMEGETEKALFAAEIHTRAKIEKGENGGCGGGEVCDQTDTAILFDNEETVGFAGRRCQGDWGGEGAAELLLKRVAASGGNLRHFKGGVWDAGELGVGVFLLK